MFNECTILIRDEMGQLHARRPDRVMISDNEAIVVDFKFGKPRPEYNEQVKQYCHLLQQMKTQPVSGYLWYVYTGKIEKVF
ncbi:UvrD/REP helicase domain protein [gut metagenome]|uniref:UvrD/REP helicase domain protein n=1 Tax=gut metagenome TaxID=749906 RepID=J9GWQ3_9ZZZZ